MLIRFGDLIYFFNVRFGFNIKSNIDEVIIISLVIEVSLSFVNMLKLW